jgi:hypothetical protein
MVTRWITKKGNDGRNRHIPINEGNRMREREISLDEQRKRSAINMDDKTKLLYQLGFIDEDGKLNTYPYLLNSFLNTPGDDKIHNLIIVKDNEIEFLATDTLGQTTLKTIMPNNIHLEEGKYGLYYDEANNSFDLKKLDPNDPRIDVKDYKKTSHEEGHKFTIDGKAYEEMIHRFNNFGPDEKYLLVFKKDYVGNYAEMNIVNTTHKSIDTIYFKVPDEEIEWRFFKIVDGKAFNRALKMINGKKSSGFIDVDLINTNLPLILSQKDKKSHVNKYGFIEPANLQEYNYDAPILHFQWN